MRPWLFLQCLFASPARREALVLQDLNAYLSTRYPAKDRPVSLYIPKPHSRVQPENPVIRAYRPRHDAALPGQSREKPGICTRRRAPDTINSILLLTCPDVLFASAKPGAREGRG